MVRIGTYPEISVTEARKIARDFAGQVARGKDPAAERAEAKRRNSSTLRTLLVAEGPYQRDLEQRGIVARKVVLSGLNRGLHRLMSKDVADLTRRDFVSAISALTAAGKPGAAGETPQAQPHVPGMVREHRARQPQRPRRPSPAQALARRTAQSRRQWWARALR
jgi:hypothetical protein